MDCLNCKNNIRKEIYDGQWGMFKYDRACLVGVRIIKDGKLNPWNEPCDKFEQGDNKIINLTDEEKRRY